MAKGCKYAHLNPTQLKDKQEYHKGTRKQYEKALGAYTAPGKRARKKSPMPKAKP